jgi:hemin uptake protein HemP
MTTVPPPKPAAPAPLVTTVPSTSRAAVTTVRIDSAQLFGAAVEVQIDHHGAIYRLKRTALGKLILTK